MKTDELAATTMPGLFDIISSPATREHTGTPAHRDCLRCWRFIFGIRSLISWRVAPSSKAGRVGTGAGHAVALLAKPELVIVDGGKGLEAALASLWDDVPVQRCTVHQERNLLAHAPGTCTTRSRLNSTT